MKTATISIRRSGPSEPAGGLIGAFGGTIPGAMEGVEVDLSKATAGDIAVLLPQVAEAYRLAVLGERTAEGFLAEGPEVSQAGTSEPAPAMTLEERIQHLRNNARSFVITSNEEYDTLPKGTLMIDRDGDSWLKTGGASRSGMAYQPLTVVYIPAEEQN